MPGPAAYPASAASPETDQVETSTRRTPTASGVANPIKRESSPADHSRGSTPSPSRLWLYYLIGALGLSVLYYVFPSEHLLLWGTLGLSSVVATVIGIIRNKPRQRIAWSLMAGALFCFIAGDTTYNVLTQFFHEVNPFPSLADLFYLLTYPLFAAGIFLLIRSRSSTRDRAALIDAVIISTGLGLLSWVYLVVPNFQADGLTVMPRLISVAYPLGDVLILAMLARLVGDGGLRIRSMQFLVLGAAGLMVADVLYGLIQLNGHWNVGGPVDAGWILFYIAWGCAALHPSMVKLSEILPRRAVQMGRARLALLTSISLIAPAVQAVTGDSVHAATVAVFSAALFLLVIARLWGILNVHQQSVQRERSLRSASGALVSAQGLRAIYQVALDGVRSLAGDTMVAKAAIYVRRGEDIDCVVSSNGSLDVAGQSERLNAVGDGGYLSTDGTLSVSPVGSEREDQGMLVVETHEAMTLDQHGALSTLAAQVALAVESANLAEDLRERRSEERFRGILQNTSDIIVIVNAAGEITYSTPSLARNLGRRAEEILGRNLASFVHDAAEAVALFTASAAGTTQTQAVADWRLRHRDGSLVAFEVLSNNLLKDPRVGGIVLTMRDVSERRALEGQLKHQAFHDALTGLANRALFQDRADHALARTLRLNTMVAMVMLDIDDFKIVNDTRGHAAGDELLLHVAERLQSTFRGDATVSRFGGDEFAVLIEDLRTVDQASRFAERALSAFTDPFTVHEEELSVNVSVGLVVTGGTQQRLDMTELMRCADLALYAAKERGKGQSVLYHQDLHTRMVDRFTRRSELEHALQAKEFILNYQPIVLIDTGELVGCEALVRWLHPTRGLIPPMDFVELAEETGLILELGRWVLDQACAQQKRWIDAGHNELRMSVNVSARQLKEQSFVDDVRSALRRHQLNPAHLVLELTESIFALDGMVVAEQLQVLRGIGVQVAMDDFGTGYSSLAYLQKFPIDVLKIDKSFVDGLGAGDMDGNALVTAIISLAHSLRLDIVAEGIEHLEQRDELWSMGCTFGQGYLYSRPVEPEQVSELLSNSQQLGPPGKTGHRDAARVRVPTLRSGP